MKVCVVGSGGREHALATVLRRHHEVVVTPGNPGIPGSVATPATEIDADLYVIGPEAPLVAGLADELRAAGKLVFGPGADGARLEGSKAWMKEVLVAAGVPTARHGTFTEAEPAFAFLDTLDGLYVVKTDGLAAGKGVIVTSDREAALEHAEKFISDGVLVEEFLDGQEVSLFFLADGKTVMPLSPAQDYKRAYDNDEGPNTGGMGAYSPLPWLPEGFVEEVTERVAQPTVNELARRGTPFVGLLYCGLIMTSRGVKVIEFNARFGDPETQVVLRRLQTNLADLLMRSATGRLDVGATAEFSNKCAVTVVLASEGYPVTNAPVREVTGIDSAEAMDDVEVCKASPTGRVLSVVGCGDSFQEARTLAYEGMARISLEGGFYRHDIGLKVS